LGEGRPAAPVRESERERERGIERERERERERVRERKGVRVLLDPPGSGLGG